MVYQVGRPWILEGNRFFPETGMPILNRARNRVRLEVWLPEPFIVATVMAKSFTASPPILLIGFFFSFAVCISAPGSSFRYFVDQSKVLIQDLVSCFKIARSNCFHDAAVHFPDLLEVG